jgi:hypothetical protein
VDTPQGTGGFDLGSHLAAVAVYALESPDSAPAAGWLTAFARADAEAVPLDRLRRERDALPDGPWKAGDDPRPLMTALPIFGVRGADGTLRTEPAELAGQDWASATDHLALFPALAERLPHIRERAAAYFRVLSEWYGKGPQHGGTPPEGGIARICHMYAALYNARLYLEAYKLLEMRWMSESAEGPRNLLRGLMQIAVGLHQIETGRYAIQQLEEGYGRIRESHAAFPAPTIGRFLKRLEKAIRLLKAYGPEKFETFDLGLFPRLWMVSPWRLLLGGGRKG